MKKITLIIICLTIVALCSCMLQIRDYDQINSTVEVTEPEDKKASEYTNCYSWPYDEFAAVTGKKPNKPQAVIDIQNSRKTNDNDVKAANTVVYNGKQFEGIWFRYGYLPVNNYISTTYDGTGEYAGITISVDSRNGEICSFYDDSAAFIEEDKSREVIDKASAEAIAKEYMKSWINTEEYEFRSSGIIERFLNEEYTLKYYDFRYTKKVNGINAEEYFVFVSDTGLIQGYGKFGEYVTDAMYPEFDGDQLCESIINGAKQILDESNLTDEYSIEFDFMGPYVVSVNNETFMVVSTLTIRHADSGKTFTTFYVTTLFD